jgi:hypothetical protein
LGLTAGRSATGFTYCRRALSAIPLGTDAGDSETISMAGAPSLATSRVSSTSISSIAGDAAPAAGTGTFGLFETASLTIASRLCSRSRVM